MADTFIPTLSGLPFVGRLLSSGVTEAPRPCDLPKKGVKGVMDSIDQFKADVASAAKVGERIKEVAAATGIPWKSLHHIYYGAVPNPRRDKVARLAKFYAEMATQ